jgi:hypothetical protein
MANAVNMYEQNKRKPAEYTMLTQALADPESKTLRKDVFDSPESIPAAAVADEEASEPSVILNCYVVGVVINANDSGPAHRIYMTDPALKFNGGTHAKLIVEYDYMLYGEDGKEQYRFAYTLTDYTTLRG